MIPFSNTNYLLMALLKIRRRNDEIVDFDRARIEQAIESACIACGEPDRSFIPVVTDFIIKDLDHVYGEIFINRVPSVEDVQDVVERNLMKFNKFDVAKEYIIYRAQRKEERVEAHEKLVKKFEKNNLKVTKANGSKEDFDIEKIEKMFKIAAKGYESQCSFDDLLEAFKKNIVEDMKTTDIAKLLVKTCIDLVTVENIAWEHVAGRLALFDLYKKSGKNRNITQKQIYTSESFLSLFETYVSEKLYYEDFFKYYSKADIKKAGEYLAKHGPARDMEYGYTTILSLSKRYLNNPNKFVRELPQEMYMGVALFLAIPEKDENRLEFAFKIYDECSSQRISLPTPTLINARTNWHQLTSCFKLNIGDDLRSIYHGIEDIAQISKYGGGVGVYLGHIRAQGAAIRGIKGAAGGDRMRAEGFACWFEQRASDSSPVQERGKTRQQYLKLAQESFEHRPDSFTFNGSANDYARASMFFYAIVDKKGMQGLMQIYKNLSQGSTNFLTEVKNVMGWDEARLNKEAKRVLDEMLKEKR